MIEFTPLASFGLLLVRPGALVMGAPAFGGLYAPAMLRVGLVGILALMVAPLVAVPQGLSTANIAVVVGRELLIGLALAMAVRVIVAAAELAGYLTGFQAGFSVAALIDPQSGVRNNIVAAFYGNIALFTFFVTNGHHRVLRGLVESYEALPLGVGQVDASLASTVISQLGLVFRVGVQLAVPVIVVLLIVELALGLLSRSAPALNLMVVGFPLRLLFGLMAIAATIGIVPTVLARLVGPALELASRAALAFR